MHQFSSCCLVQGVGAVGRMRHLSIWGRLPRSQVLMAALHAMRSAAKVQCRIPTKREKALWGKLPFTQVLTAA